MTGAAGSPEDLADPRTRRLLDVIEERAGLSRDSGLPARLVRGWPPADRPVLADRLRSLSWRDPAWQDAVAPLLVHETYLFRDWRQLAHLAEVGLPSRIARSALERRHTLRIWSAGCASGEEAYSLGALALMAMLAAGVARERDGALAPMPGWRLSVLGSDVSADMVARARRGSFATAGLSAFRAMPPGYDAFFTADGPGTRQARADLRPHIRFELGNLLDGPPPIIDADVVACRNVLIYLGAEARRTALATLVSAVAPGGFLLLGSTDQAPAVGFDALWGANAVIYRRGDCA